MPWTRNMSDNDFDTLRNSGRLVCTCYPQPGLERASAWFPTAWQCVTCKRPPLATLSPSTLARAGEPPAEAPSPRRANPPQQAPLPLGAASGAHHPPLTPDSAGAGGAP